MNHINTLNTFIAFATLVSTYLTKPLTQVHPNIIILHKLCLCTNFVDYADNFCPLCGHYAQNYAGIIGSSLKRIHYK